MMINRGTKLKFSTIIYIFCISIALSNCEPAKLLKNTASTHEFIQTNFEHQNLAAPKADKLDNSESQIRIQQIDTVKSISDGLGQNDADPNELTSVHRVWTASSSGSLDELSPEMISKFNNALPFLAAYATRPRLVGGQPQSASAVGVQQGDRASIGSGEAKFGAGLQVASSSPHKSRASIVPKLASLNEVSFDVSSLSKSEHHHRRKTILKRRNDKSGPKKRAQSAVSKRNSNKLSNKSTKRISTRRNSRRRSKKVSHSKRRGDSLRLTQPSSRQSVASDQSKVNPIDGVKGGGNVAKREPFFSSIRPNESDKKTMNNVKPTTATKVDDSEDRDIGEPSDSGDSEDSDNEPEFEPKRVGDSDVDEDGDTVTVMPKFDGVDDDPVLVADDTDGEQDELPGRGDTEADKDTKTSTGDDRSESSEGQDEPSGSGLAGGGGIGATTGSGGTAGSSQDSDVDDKDEKPRDTSDSGRPTSGARKVNDVQPGVELADHDDDDANAKDADDSKSGERKSTETKSDAGAKGNSINTNTNTNNSVDNDSGDDGDGDDDLSNNSVGSKVGGGRDSSSSGKDDRQGSGHDIGENDSDDIDYPVDGGEARVGHEGPKTVKGNGNGPKNGKPDQDCHHDDGLYHDHSHHSHHDTIKWLEDAIPGEPGVDYPILAGANVSGSRFSCRDQKWPGFYADVSNRCQVFHFCQPDGRRDSFVCPNGTIFSQISLVCVWWSGFDCEDSSALSAIDSLNQAAKLESSISEQPANSINSLSITNQQDAPNYYDRNAELYKKTRSKFDESDSRSVNSRESSSIDSLIKSMRAGGASQDDLMSLRPSHDDEATIQRKSTSDDVGSAKLKRADPNRRRRATNRSGPPKLKSRMRVSRRRIRHNVKPKRRA